MDIRLVNPFVEGLAGVFQAALGLTPRRCALRLESAGENGAVLTSFVSISGHVRGVVVLRLPPTTALRLVDRLRGTTSEEIDDDVIDAVAQIISMIADAAKTRLSCVPPLELGLPTVVHGRDYDMRYPTQSARLELPFDSDVGRFTMELAFGSS